MKFTLLRAPTFIRKAKKFIKKQPELANNIKETIILLSLDPFHPQLKTHKLKGQLKECYACSVGYDLRIIFKFQEMENTTTILLQSIGTHDEVY